jgi:hypothetical protein
MKKMITKEEFEQYEGIRRSGVINMFDVKGVVALSDSLTREKCIEIMTNYSELYKQYYDHKYI